MAKVSENAHILFIVLPYCDLKTILNICEIIDVPDGIIRKFTKKSYAEFLLVYMENFKDENKHPCNRCFLPTNDRTDYECWNCETIYCTPCFNIVGIRNYKYAGDMKLVSGNICKNCKNSLKLCNGCQNYSFDLKECSGCNKVRCSHCRYQSYQSKKEWKNCTICEKIHCSNCFSTYKLKCPSWIPYSETYISSTYSRTTVHICSICIDQIPIPNMDNITETIDAELVKL